jgi:acyl-CoA synthetase (AMP-forming)/AMP-acid ligase II
VTPAETQPDGPGASPAPLAETITGAVLALADVDTLGLVANDLRLTHAEVAARAAARAAWLQANRQDGAFHVALMLDNVPEFIFWLEAAALAGAVVVGANPTHRGACSSPRAPPARPRPACAARAGWPGSAPSWPRCSSSPDDVCYLAMPLFHSNALMAGWAPALAAGATVALRERFSASQFLPDVRRYGVTYFNYVGKPLSYILATPSGPTTPTTPLRRAFGNEAAEADVARFAERFGCTSRTPTARPRAGASVHGPPTPPGGPGPGPPGTIIINPTPGEECPRAVFDEHGRLLNAEEAIGEMVNQTGAAGFEGYWRNAEAEAARCATAGTGPATWPTGTTTTSSTSPAATTTGCGSTARTSPPPRRGHPPAPPRRGAGLGLRRARHRGGRPGHGDGAAPARSDFDPEDFARLPGRPGVTWAPSGHPASCA